MATSESPKVGIIMGSQSDWPVMKEAARLLGELGVAYEARIVSAHRTPDRLISYAKDAKSRGLKVIIAGAGGAAHLPGMTASMTPLPVLGVPRDVLPRAVQAARGDGGHDGAEPEGQSAQAQAPVR